MTSDRDREAFVWIWLPNETEPVVAGRLEADNGNILFNYGKSYLERVHDGKPVMPVYDRNCRCSPEYCLCPMA